MLGGLEVDDSQDINEIVSSFKQHEANEQEKEQERIARITRPESVLTKRSSKHC